MLAGIIESFAEACPGAELVVLSADPAGTKSQHRVRAADRMKPGELLSALGESDLLISGGGSLLQNTTSARSLAYYLSVIWLAKRLHKKVMVYAQGIGPLTGYPAQWAVKSVLNQVDLITIRDDASKACLEKIGVTRPDIRVTADPAFAMKPAPDEDAVEILKATGVPEGVPLIGVSLRNWKNDVHWLPVLSRGLDAAASKIGAVLVFLPMQRDRDTSISVQMASQMSVPSFVISGQHTPDQIMSITSRMSLVVGMRLHSLIFSASAGVPFLSISYDPKVEAFTHVSGQDEPINLDGLTASVVTSRVIDVWDRKDDLARRIDERVPRLRAAAFENAELACGLLAHEEH